MLNIGERRLDPRYVPMDLMWLVLDWPAGLAHDLIFALGECLWSLALNYQRKNLIMIISSVIYRVFVAEVLCYISLQFRI
jgi:hypothetical protein